MVSRRRVWAGMVVLSSGLTLASANCDSSPETTGAAPTESLGTSEEAVGGAVGDWTGFTDGQCVHGVYQFYLHRYGISLPGACAEGSNVGNCENCGACMIWEGNAVHPPASLFNRYDWGTTMPQTYDIVVYPPKTAAVGPGHVACVDHIDGSDPSHWQSMYVMDTNWYGNEKMATSVHTVTRAPYGIYRLKSLDNAQPKGFLDGADCNGVAGWAQDPSVPTKAIDTDLYFDGPAGDSAAISIRLLAGLDRPDLCTPLGSCNHAYSLPTPRGAMNGATHTVYAYGIDSAGGANTLLTNAPKSFSCAAPAIPPNVVKRQVGSPAILGAWKFSTFFDMATYDQAAVDGVPSAVDVPAAPSLIQATGAPEIDVVDGSERRPIADMTSFGAWRFTTDMVKEVDPSVFASFTQGLSWPATPLLIKSNTADAVYVLDAASPTFIDPSRSSNGAGGGARVRA